MRTGAAVSTRPHFARLGAASKQAALACSEIARYLEFFVNIQMGISNLTRLFRAIVYLIVLFYLFLGVSIVADRFMSAIEVITSREREVKVIKPSGAQVTVLVRV